MTNPETEAEKNAVHFLSQHLHPGILRANILARRLDNIVQEMGTAISDGLYRRAREAVQRGDYHFITADHDNRRVFEALQRLEPSRVIGGPVPDIGLPRNPRELREAWEDLSPADREELFHLDPFLGNRAGIPHIDRDVYCRRTLQDLTKQARASGDDELATIYERLTRLINGPEQGQPSFFLSHIDRNGRAAFSLGNPDLADNNVVLLRPAGPRDLVAYAEPNLRQLHSLAMAVEPRKKTVPSFCSIYPHPGSMVQTIFPQFAEDAGALVRNYHDGLRASHVGTPAHTTTVGHSYAGVVAGHAAGGGATLDTDNMLLIGNWGTGAHHVDELRLASGNSAENILGTISQGDSVQAMPPTHGPPPAEPVHWMPQVHGTSPTASEFGARTFATAPLPGYGIWNPHEHSARHYLDSGNPSAGTIGLVMTGHEDLVR